MVLKLGSTGSYVVKLQQFLKITADGDFGPKTEASVKKWQSENELVVDGIVGPVTWDAMGLTSANSNVIELSLKMREVVTNAIVKAYPESDILAFEESIIENFLPLNQIAGSTDPMKFDQSTDHYTAGGPNPYRTCRSWASNSSKVATHNVVGGRYRENSHGDVWEDGQVLQAIPWDKWAWHTGSGSRDGHWRDQDNLGTEVCNYGWIVMKNGKFYNAYNTVIPEEDVVENSHRGFDFWYKITDAQVNSIKWLHILKAYKFGIPIAFSYKRMFELNYKGMALDGYPGMYTHNSFVPASSRVDIHPQPNLIEAYKEISEIYQDNI